MSDIKPGLHFDLSDEDYHADPIPGGSLSSTFARLLTEHVPSKALERRKRKPTKAMNLGKAVHAHALGAGPELVVWQYDGRTKDGKAERAEWKPKIEADIAVGVTQAERDQILGMAEALHSNAEVAEILAAHESEVTVLWQEGDLWMRARIDLLSERDSYDYKTTQDASRRGFSKAMASYGYHQQAHFYQRGLAAIGHPAGKVPMRFICQESEPPYLVQIHLPDHEAMAAAEHLNERAIRIYAECQRSGTWPGYTVLRPDPAPLPSYYFYDNEEALA